MVAIYLTGAATILLLLVPFIPGLRDIPRWIPVHRLVWRSWNNSPANPAVQAPPEPKQPRHPAGSAGRHSHPTQPAARDAQRPGRLCSQWGGQVLRGWTACQGVDGMMATALWAWPSTGCRMDPMLAAPSGTPCLPMTRRSTCAE